MRGGGNRKFILVQIDEATPPTSEAFQNGYKYIPDICIERTKRALQDIQNNNPNLKTGFKVYQLADSNFARSNFAPDSKKSDTENLQLLKEYIEQYENQLLSFDDMSNSVDFFDEILLKQGFMLNYSKEQDKSFTDNAVYHINDSFKECLICLDKKIHANTLKQLEVISDSFQSTFICMEQALDTSAKWNLKRVLSNRLICI